MSKQNFKSQAKRKRELAKLDKRQAKDQKRASRRTEQPGADAPVAAIASAQPTAGVARSAPVAPVPLTLAQVVERWKNTKVAKPKHR